MGAYTKPQGAQEEMRTADTKQNRVIGIGSTSVKSIASWFASMENGIASMKSQ